MTPIHPVTAATPTPASAGHSRAAASVGPETANEACHQPVEQRRLVEVAHAIRTQRRPVAGRAQGFGDGRVKAFRRVEEGGGAEPEQVHRADGEQGEREREPRQSR
jgi:hypothetical protein